MAAFKPIALRIDAATRANIDAIIESGIAKDTSAALRAGAAALARGLVADPRVWVIHAKSKREKTFRVCPTKASAEALLTRLGAIHTGPCGLWTNKDEYGDESDIITYFIECVLL